MKLSAYAKAIVAAIGAGATWAISALDDNHVSSAEWAALVVGVLTALGVYQVRNTEPAAEDTSGGFTVTELCLLVVAVIAMLWAFGVIPRS